METEPMTSESEEVFFVCLLHTIFWEICEITFVLNVFEWAKKTGAENIPY